MPTDRFFLALAIAALPVAGHAEEANFSSVIEEVCEFTGTVSTIVLEESEFAGTADIKKEFDVPFRCNTTFATTIEESPAPLKNSDANVTDDYVTEVAITETNILANGTPLASGSNYKGDIGTVRGFVTFENPAKPLAGGVYSTSVTFNITPVDDQPPANVFEPAPL